jgi:hypothetical protein
MVEQSQRWSHHASEQRRLWRGSSCNADSEHDAEEEAGGVARVNVFVDLTSILATLKAAPKESFDLLEVRGDNFR